MTRTQKVLESCGFEKRPKLKLTLYSREGGKDKEFCRTEKTGGAYFWKKGDAVLAHVPVGNGPIRFFKKRTDNPYGRYYLAGSFPRRDFLLHSSEYLTAVRLVDL